MLTQLFLFLLLSLGINMAMFVVAYKRQSDKLTDASYAVTFIVIGAVAYVNSAQSMYHTLLAAMVGIWAIRIGSFLLYRVIKKGKDQRFDDTRGDFVKFAKFWIVQAVAVWTLMIPSVWALGSNAEVSSLVIVGACVWVFGFLIESVADAQKYMFSQDAGNKNKWIQSGVWKYSRHPNYFGEILVWVGVYIVAAQSLDPMQSLVAIVSPLFIATLLLFFSGIPILEKSADKRWGDMPAYRRYKRRTSLIVPLPPRE